MAVTTPVPGVSIVMPAFRAERTIGRAVRSVLGQTHPTWELIIVADDGTDYEAELGRTGLADARIRHFSTGRDGSGSPPARNLGLEHARYALSAILDADDAMLPEKLAIALPLAEEHGIVSSAIRIESAEGTPLRTVGTGPDRMLDPGTYKFVNFSMDSMLVYDRKRADPRFNTEFPCLTDIEFLLRLFEKTAAVHHLGSPLHIYGKHPASVSNKPGAGIQMIATKHHLIDAIGAGAYPLAAPDGRAGLLRFYEISLAAEQSYGARLAENPGLLFEDHLEPLLAAEAPQARPVTPWPSRSA
jgi:glycosyltransferase involved in cell wall biosynthesis